MSKTFKTYRYWRFTEEWLKNAGICAAVEVDGDTRVATIAYSFCSPNEKAFHKDRARMIADGRLEAAVYTNRNSAIVVQLPQDKTIGKTLNQVVFGDALCDMFLRQDTKHNGDNRLPQWVVKATGCDKQDNELEE